MCGSYLLDLEDGIYPAGIVLTEDIMNFNLAPTHTAPVLIDHWGAESANQPLFEHKLDTAPSGHSLGDLLTGL